MPGAVEIGVGEGQLCVGKRVVRVNLDGLFVFFDGLVQLGVVWLCFCQGLCRLEGHVGGG